MFYRKTVAGHDGAERAARSTPPDVMALENGDAGAKTSGFKPDRQSGKACADDADVNVEIERKSGPLAQWPAVRRAATYRGNLAHGVFLRIDLALVTLS
jgi:hypothetical protein